MNKFSTKYHFATLFLLLCLVLFSAYLYQSQYKDQQELISVQENRYNSYLLTTQLRRSSDELTRLVRTYAVTGNPKFEKQFWEILSIRNGQSPLPDHYDRVYWDFLAVENRNLNEALQLINEVLKEDPDEMNSLDTKAVILYQKGEYQKTQKIVLQYEDRITKDDLAKDPTYSYYLGRIKWAVGDTVSAKSYFNYALKQTDPDAGEKRDQQELIKFMAEHNL